MPKLVVHCKKDQYDVYIGRPSIWGNPFKIGRDGKRGECIELYKGWIAKKSELQAKAKKELKGKILGCWCKPRACHGDVLAEIANFVGENKDA
jgi:hypothetical protein